VANGLLTNWLGSKRDKGRYEHEQVMAREARVQERSTRRTSRSVSTRAHAARARELLRHSPAVARIIDWRAVG